MWDLPIPTFSFSLPLALTLEPEWRMRRLKGVGASWCLCLGGKNFHVPYWPGLNPMPLQVCTSAGYGGQMWVSLAKCFFKVLQMVGMKLRLVPCSGLFPSECWLMSLIRIVSLRNHQELLPFTSSDHHAHKHPECHIYMCNSHIPKSILLLSTIPSASSWLYLELSRDG